MPSVEPAALAEPNRPSNDYHYADTHEHGHDHEHSHDHTHRDVSGGWLRAGTFGAMDGLVTNVALIAGFAGSDVGNKTVVLAGMAGLVAGAFSMAAGEYTSVQ